MKIAVLGGKRLSGAFEPSGSKNATLPIIFASIINAGVSTLRGAADIGDVSVAVRIIEELGARVERSGDILKIDTADMVYKKPSSALTSKIRASSYLLGASLARFGVFHISEIGGWNFCNRPIDMHVEAALSLGAEIKDGVLYAKKLSGGRIKFSKKSVGATMNALIMAASADSEVLIEGAASEPHVKCLADYLVSLGAKIEFKNDSISVIPGVLSEGSVDIIPDMIEAGTYLLLAPLTDGRITVKCRKSLELESFFEAISDSGIGVEEKADGVTVYGSPSRPIQIKTAPHPGFPTDLQPQIAPVMAKHFGGIIDECVWQNRFSYLDALSSFGVHFCKGNSRAVILPSELHSGLCEAPDLRGGAAALMCALSCEGRSEISALEIIKRGYSDLAPKLISLGAEVYEIKD